MIDVDVFELIVAALAPNVTLALARFDPEIVTDCPPAVGPLEGSIDVIEGAAT